MNLSEELLRLLLSLLGGAIGGAASGLLIERNRISLQDKRCLKDTPQNLSLFATCFKSAILNNDNDLEQKIRPLLFNNYHAFCNKEELIDAFTKLNIMYSFLKASGYKDNKERIEPDIIKINEIIQKLNKKVTR